MTPLYMEARTAVNTYHILRMSGELQQHVNFSTILEPGSVRSRCGWAGLFSLEASPLDTQTAVFSGSSLCVRLMRMGFPQSSVGKESACNVGDLGSIPGLGRSPGEGKGYPLQYSGLENSMDCIVHRVAKSQTRLSDFNFQLVM